MRSKKCSGIPILSIDPADVLKLCYLILWTGIFKVPLSTHHVKIIHYKVITAFVNTVRDYYLGN